MKNGHRTNYVLDANVFLEAQLRYYAFDVCPGFWEALLLYELGSVDKVRAELENDELKKWVDKRVPDHCFASTASEDVINHFKAIMEWVQGQDRYYDRAKAEFAGEADGWLVAYAKATDSIIVTQEKVESNARNKVRVPDVCKAFNVRCVDTFDMLRHVRASFVLNGSDDE